MCDDCNALLRVATSYVRRDTSNFKNLREKKYLLEEEKGFESFNGFY